MTRMLTALDCPGSRRCIRRDIYPPPSIDRHSRPPDVSALTLAKRIRRTVDRLDPQGMPRSYRGVRRTPSAPCAAVLHGLPLWHAHSLIVEQGRADIACRRGSGTHSVPSDPGWTASPICSGLIYSRHKSTGHSYYPASVGYGPYYDYGPCQAIQEPGGARFYRPVGYGWRPWGFW